MLLDSVGALLGLIYNPTCNSDRKRAAEQQLDAFSKTLQGIEWAVNTVQTPSTDAQEQFFAASLLQTTVARRWHLLSPAYQEGLRNCLWTAAMQPSHIYPSFVTAKLIAALAQLACIDWQQQFWDQLQACFADGARAEAGVRILTATLEQLFSMSQGTTVALCGKVCTHSLTYSFYFLSHSTHPTAPTNFFSSFSFHLRTGLIHTDPCHANTP